MDPLNPATVSYGFEYHEVRDCKVDWSPKLPLSLKNQPNDANCCIAFETNLFDNSKKFSNNYICSTKGSRGKCISEIK